MSDVSRAETAKKFLEDEVVKDAFSAAEAAFVKEWKQAEDATRRELAWAKIQGLEEVKHQLRRIITTGEMTLIAKSKSGSQ